MRLLLFSNSAVEDLTQIWNYTVDNWSEERADQYYLDIISSWINDTGSIKRNGKTESIQPIKEMLELIKAGV